MSETEGVDSPDNRAARQGDVVSLGSSQIKLQAASWHGPLPPPAALRSFEEVVPGSAERILAMAEKQADHRIAMEKNIVKGDFRLRYAGLAVGTVLSLVAILGGMYLISLGHELVGGSLIGIHVVGLAAVFVLGTASRRAQHN